MDTSIKSIFVKDRKVTFAVLWIFVLFNYLYCDLISNMDAAVLKELIDGHAGSILITQGFLLGAAILMEIPTAMILLSWILNYRVNRWANIIAGSIMTLVQVSSLFFGTGPTIHYVYYSIIEAACTLFIAIYAWMWRNPEG